MSFNSNFFRGFIRLADEPPYKKPIDRFNFNDPLFTSLDEISSQKHIGGVLRADRILIDIDSSDMAKRFIDLLCASGVRCMLIRTTRGVHAIFKNDEKMFPKNSTHQLLAVGVEADIKAGSRASFSVIKQQGQFREIILDCDGEPDKPPKWLMPMTTKVPDFYSMGEGDGRNNALYGYISTLGSRKYGFSEDEAFECIRLMNNFVMQHPLDESELNIILRRGAMPTRDGGSGRSGNKFEHWTVGNELIDEYFIKRINGSIHIYKDGVYVPARHGWLDNVLISKDPTLTAARRMEVGKYIEGRIMNNTPPTDARYIAFRNGLYDIVDGRLMEFDSEMILTNKINFDYVEGAYSELADNVLNKLACNDSQVRALLEEVIGYTFYRRSELRKAFILIGDKANGKSTYLDMIKTLLGDENVSSVDLGELGDRFKTAELVGKLANIGDDISENFVSNAAIFKKLVSGDRLNAEMKGQNPFDFSNYAKLLFSANAIPRIKDKSGAVLDRLIIVPFDATFSKDDPDYDPYIKYKLRSSNVMEYLIQIGIQGLKRVLENNGFSEGDRVKKELETYNKDNNPVLLFLDDIEFETDLINQPVRDVYLAYTVFCTENNFQPLGNIAFSRAVIRQFPNVESVKKKIKGKDYRIFRRRVNV